MPRTSKKEAALAFGSEIFTSRRAEPPPTNVRATGLDTDWVSTKGAFRTRK